MASDADLDMAWIEMRRFFDWEKFFRCRVRILIVTDSSSGGFDTISGFHLGHMLEILATDPWWHVVFEVTKAHRQTATTADISNFRFDAQDLSAYHQIWLFGIDRQGPNPLSASELRALAQFMDQGGGVFATGDHEDLGLDMCAEVPRVRSMRRWYHPNPGPNGEPVAPDQTGEGRHDTLTDDPATPIIEANQSDKIPQRIRPIFYSYMFPGGLFGKVTKFPHPVLCGPSGIIDYLPDHMHEGLCEVPSDLTRSYTFDGYTTQEYPQVGSAPHPPEVIARATNTVTGGEFGVLAAYDGHRASIGRVLVDATWHHWFNINLTGFLAATDPANPSYDPTVVPKWEEIKAYFRNVAAWLAPPGMQRCLRNGGWIFVTRYYDILITRRSLESVTSLAKYYWQLGIFARDALGRRASQCQLTRWFIEIAEWLDLRFIPDVWGPRPPEPDPPPWIDYKELEAVLVGGVVHALAEAFGDVDDVETLVLQRGKDIEQVAQDGARRAFAELAKRYVTSAQALERLADGGKR